jgi:hypothetical protein
MPDPGVVPTVAQSVQAGIKIVQTNAQHVEMSDRGSDHIKESIGATLDQFLHDDEMDLQNPYETGRP